MRDVESAVCKSCAEDDHRGQAKSTSTAKPTGRVQGTGEDEHRGQQRTSVAEYPHKKAYLKFEDCYSYDEEEKMSVGAWLSSRSKGVQLVVLVVNK